MQVVRAVPSPDLQGRPDISWTSVVLRLPDDGTGALPLLRHLILMDAKSSICRSANPFGTYRRRKSMEMLNEEGSQLNQDL